MRAVRARRGTFRAHPLPLPTGCRAFRACTPAAGPASSSIPVAGSDAALRQRAHSRELQQLLEAGDRGGARALLARLLQDDEAKPHHVTAVLKRGCEGPEHLVEISEQLDDGTRGSLAAKLHEAWLQHRDFKQAAAALGSGVRSGVLPPDAVSRLAVRTLQQMQKRRAPAGVQRAYVKHLSSSDVGTLPYAYAALFAAANSGDELQDALFQLDHEAGSDRLHIVAAAAAAAAVVDGESGGGEVAWLALHQAWVRLGRGEDAARALARAIPAGGTGQDSAAPSCEREAASVTTAVVQLLGGGGDKDRNSRNRGKNGRRRGARHGREQARAYLSELTNNDNTAWLLNSAHFNPLARACQSHDEVASLLELMATAGVEADAPLFATLQEVGLRLGDGQQTADALRAAVAQGVLSPHDAGEIATTALRIALRGSAGEGARIQGWAYFQQLTTATTQAAASEPRGSRVALPPQFFNALLGVAWRGVDVVGIIGSMADVYVAPDRSTYMALHAALLRLGEIEGAAAALGRGVASEEWVVGDGAGATATLALRAMLDQATAEHARDNGAASADREGGSATGVKEREALSPLSVAVRAALSSQPPAPHQPEGGAHAANTSGMDERGVGSVSASAAVDAVVSERGA